MEFAEPIRPSLTLEAPPAIPEQYVEAVVSLLRSAYERIRWTLQEHYGHTVVAEAIMLNNDDLLRTPLADSLAEIARAAAGEREHDAFSDGVLEEAIQDVCEILFASKVASGYVIPEEFWTTDAGAMISRARLWLYGENLITIAEAAEIADVTAAAISQQITKGKLRAFVDPDANIRQGRRLVDKRDL